MVPFVGIHILITLELWDRVWWVFNLQQPCHWKLNISAAKIDKKIVTQGEKLNESSIPTMSVSKEGVETENILSQAYVVPCKEEEREKDAPSLARNEDTPLMQICYTRVSFSQDCVALDPAVTGSPNFIVFIHGCTGTTDRVDVSTGAYGAGSCAVNGSPNVSKTLFEVGLLSEVRKNPMQQVELGKSMGQQFEDTPTVQQGSK